ncbi:MAG: hypothetical protein ACJAXJ_000215 [Colwellia sp.]|jgi:hypothetical protein
MKIKYFLTLLIVINTLIACSSHTKVEPKPEINTTRKINIQEGKYERLQRENYFNIENEIRNPSQQDAEVYVKNIVMDLVLKLAPYVQETVLVDTSTLNNTSYSAIKDEKIDMIISLFYKELTEFGISIDEKNTDNNHIKTVLEIKLIKENNKYNIICFIKKNNSDIVYNVIVASLPAHLIESTRDGVSTYL